MVRMLFGSVGKILDWIVTIIIFFGLYSYSVILAFGVLVFLLILGPCVAIPAMIAAHGRHILSDKSIPEVQQIAARTFQIRRAGRTWTPISQGLGQVNYELSLKKSDSQPVVSVDFTPADQGGVIVSVWMSEWTSGGLNGGKGTPFWVWGGVRALNKVSEIAKAIA